MQVIEKVIEYTRPDDFKILALGDIHAGVVHCAEADIRQKVEQIAKERNSFWIGMGDYADCIVPDDRRWESGIIAPWVKENNIVSSEKKWLKSLFNPINHKGLALLMGNHEDTIRKILHVDLLDDLCEELGIPYGGYSCFIRLLFRRKNSNDSHAYTIHAWHGAGSAQTEGARLMRLKRLVKEMEADIYLMGHLHAITHDITDRLCVRNKKIKVVPQVATITGSWLKTYCQDVPPSYGEKAGFKPSHLGCPCIIINPDKETITYQS